MAGYLLYVVAAGALPFIREKPLSAEFAESVSVSDFYGDTLCTDRAALVESPEDGFYTRIRMINEAEERIDVSYYAIHMGESSDIFLGALLDAADRGVRVRILADGLSGGLTTYHKDYAAALGAHPNIELKNYNPPSFLKPWTWNGRLHDKYMIVDDCLLLFGGRNIGDKYFAPNGYEGAVSYDRDVLVYGTGDSVLFRVREYMDALWDGKYVCMPFSEDTEKGSAKRLELCGKYRDFYADNAEIIGSPEYDPELRTFPVNCITFICGDVNIGTKEPKTGYVLEQLLLSANESAVMQSPYVVLDRPLEEALCQLGESGVRAEIITNSAASSPNIPACSVYCRDKRKILHSSVALTEYQGENSIHAKTYIIDRRLTVIGSYNLDPRSAHVDTEMLLAIDSEEFARQVAEFQEEYLSRTEKSSGATLPKKAAILLAMPFCLFFRYLV